MTPLSVGKQGIFKELSASALRASGLGSFSRVSGLLLKV